MMVKEKIWEKPQFTRDVVIGMGDGLTVSFALVAGLTVLFSGSSPILFVGVVVVLLQSIAMGLSGWFSGKGEQDYYYNELSKINDPEGYNERELREQLAFYDSMGFPAEMQRPALTEIDQNNREWVEFLQRFDLGPSEPGSGAPVRSALNIGLSYASGGLIPLIAYYFFDKPALAIIYSVAATLLSLFVLGYFKSRLTGSSPFSMAFNVMLTGAVTALCTYLIALIFR